MILQDGTLLNERYEIESMIGQGGMSYVYRALDRKMGREVAVKVLKEEYCEDADFIRELRPEGEDRQVQLIKNVLFFIREHYREKIYIHDLSGLGGLNDQYFIRFFKSVMGLPPLDYINRYRVLLAAEQLVETDRRICDIAEDCGFHNIGNFIKVFRTFMGALPREYRKNPDAYQKKEKKE